VEIVECFRFDDGASRSGIAGVTRMDFRFINSIGAAGKCSASVPAEYHLEKERGHIFWVSAMSLYPWQGTFIFIRAPFPIRFIGKMATIHILLRRPKVPMVSFTLLSGHRGNFLKKKDFRKIWNRPAFYFNFYAGSPE